MAGESHAQSFAMLLHPRQHLYTCALELGKAAVCRFVAPGDRPRHLEASMGSDCVHACLGLRLMDSPSFLQVVQGFAGLFRVRL